MSFASLGDSSGSSSPSLPVRPRLLHSKRKEAPAEGLAEHAEEGVGL
jgi:hypothetical protein